MCESVCVVRACVHVCVCLCVCGCQIALGIHYMHSRRVLHRDIKCQNIFLLGNGRLVLGDLGISKVLDGTLAFASTQIGTPYYMSPELFKNKVCECERGVC